MSHTTIQWTDRTWNPVRGCSRVSPGCVHCYAERQAARFAGPMVRYADPPIPGLHLAPAPPFAGFVHKVNGHAAWTGKVELIESKLEEPLHWKKPCRVFVNSMSDLFHESLPDEAIDQVFAVMALCPHITFQVLTKRAERMRNYFAPGTFRDALIATRAKEVSVSVVPFKLPSAAVFDARRVARGESWEFVTWPLPNVWLGVSVESKAYLERIDVLRETPAAIRFVSLEPLLEDLGEINFKGIDWAIIGGESGPDARPFDIAWPRRIIPQCRRDGVAPFMKQVGHRPQFRVSNVDPPQSYYCERDPLHGGDPEDWPLWMRVREFPRGTTAENAVAAQGRVAKP